jgi:hypothetical protein
VICDIHPLVWGDAPTGSPRCAPARHLQRNMYASQHTLSAQNLLVLDRCCCLPWPSMCASTSPAAQCVHVRLTNE